MANLIQNFKDNCSNFLYIFIADDAAREVFGNAPVILKKRQNQIAYVTKAAQMSKYSYQQLKDAIAEEIIAVYGKTPGEVLLDVANGKNVYSKTEVRRANSSSIGRCNGIGNIDPNTGYPVGKNKDNYATVLDTENGDPIGRFDLSTGEQVSHYSNGKWIAGATPETDKNSRNMWVNNINWNNIIMAIIDLIGRLFGVRKAKNVASYQSDGWAGITQNTAQNSTNNILPILLLGVAGYMLVTADNSEGKKKKKNNS